MKTDLPKVGGFSNEIEEKNEIRAREHQAVDTGVSLPAVGDTVPHTQSVIGMSALNEDGSETATRIRIAKLRLGFVWLVVIVCVLAKGLLVKICDPMWWVLNFGTALALGGTAYHFASQLSTQVQASK